MTTPLATYRLQLREGMTFARAAALAPYMQELGVSHVYLAPIFRAVPGSTHGYDAADFNEIDPDLGGASGFAKLAAALSTHGLKIIVDFVPNHMGASPANPWWRDVLEWGPASRYAQHFDVDWSAPKLIVPALGKPYGEALAAGELRLHFDAKDGAFCVRYYELELPLTPPSYATILTLADPDGFAALSRRFAACEPDDSDMLRRDLAAVVTEPAPRQRIEAAVTQLEGDKPALHTLFETQAWRLAHWRASRESLTYRRFFEISDLVGVRVEQARVFDDVHGTIIGLVQQGAVAGLRIDHIDGLADPLGYLERLRRHIGGGTYLVVEKILGEHETVRSEWPIDGTTGYEFIREVAPLFVAECEQDLSQTYAAFVGRETNFHAEAVAIKRRTITRNLAGELDVLTGQALELARSDIDTRDYGADTLRRAIIEIASNFSVYRTYVSTAGAQPADLAELNTAAAAAKISREVEDETAIDLVVRYLTLQLEAPERQVAALAFATRFQQTTGPLMAKALEDTLFYRFNRLIAVNEVGGEPDRLNGDIATFHRAMIARQRDEPRALTATATHDTKRGEDARCRIYAISEIARIWGTAVDRWSELLSPHRRGEDETRVPEPEMEWMFYQALLGAWPAASPTDDELQALQERMVAFMQKAAREVKLHTSWTRPDEAYETALAAFVRGAMTSDAFRADFSAVAAPLILAGAVNSLTQLVIKLFVPGVPDIYQGCELWDLSLVDPDNRRPVDFAARSRALQMRETSAAKLLQTWQDATIKLHCLRHALAVRRRLGDALVAADYVELEVEGPFGLHVVAFARVCENEVVIAVGTRFALQLLDGATVPHVAPDRWQDTVVRIPERLCGGTLENVFTRQTSDVHDGGIAVADLLAQLPVAVLTGARSTLP